MRRDAPAASAYPPPRRRVGGACAFCDRPITEANDYRFVTVGGAFARAHRFCAAPGERPRG